MESESWVFRVKAYDGESLGHFLGRFRRANHLSSKVIAKHLGIRVEWVKAWESPSHRRNPTDLQLLALSRLVEVESDQLAKMLPPSRLHLQTRLCGVCYGESPVHRVAWQQFGVEQCERHGLRLLSACPICQTGFRTPALWEDNRCESCQLPFHQMRPPQELGEARSSP